MQIEIIERRIKDGLKSAEVYVDGDGTHFNALIISNDFLGKTRVARQQMVYNTVFDLLQSGELHALSTKTMTQAEWDAIEQAENNKEDPWKS